MSDLRFCPACGAQLPRVAGVPVRFCPGCGVRLEGVVGYSGTVGATDGATADDDADEGGDPSVDAPADAPVETAGVASSSRDAAATDAPHIGDLELHAACDTSGGQALAQVALPRGWHIEEAHLERSGSFDCPISVGVTAAGPMGERIMYRSELCYVDAGAVAKRIPTQTERKVFVHVEAACDELAQACAARLGARAEVVAEQPYPSSAAVDIERERARVKREAANDFAIQGFSMEPSDVVYECRMRRYRLTGAPVPTELAVAAKVEGYMFSIGGVAGSLGKGVAAGAEALLGAGLSRADRRCFGQAPARAPGGGSDGTGRRARTAHGSRRLPGRSVVRAGCGRPAAVAYQGQLLFGCARRSPGRGGLHGACINGVDSAAQSGDCTRGVSSKATDGA